MFTTTPDTNTEFYTRIHAATPCLVEFYAPWTEASEAMVPVLNEVREIAGEKAVLFRLDIKTNKLIALSYQVYTVPTLMLFRGGQVFWRKQGLVSAHEILRHLDLLVE
jgi:thioredoxin 1